MIFHELSKKQLQIMIFPYTQYSALICDGAVRSGKTVMMSISFLQWAMSSFSGMNFGICGKTVRSAERNIIMPLLSIASLQKKYQMKYTRSQSMLNITDAHGRENHFYIFGGKDESSYMLIQGITLAGVFLDEVALMPKSFVDQALARCSVEGAKYWFNCNPENPRHWFYQEWICDTRRHNALHLHFQMEDNPSLSKEKLEEYHNMYSGTFYRRYVLGEWIPAEGLVYPMFSYEKNVTTNYTDNGRYFVSIDYGTRNAFAAGLWRYNGKNAVMVREYYYDGHKEETLKTDEEYYAALLLFIGNKRIEYMILDPSALSFRETIRRHGKYSVRNADNDVMNGIRLTSTLLNAGILLFDPSCVKTLEEFESYVWDEDSVEDAVIKDNDHSMDQVRYFSSTVLKKELRNNPALSRFVSGKER